MRLEVEGHPRRTLGIELPLSDLRFPDYLRVTIQVRVKTLIVMKHNKIDAVREVLKLIIRVEMALWVNVGGIGDFVARG